MLCPGCKIRLIVNVEDDTGDEHLKRAIHATADDDGITTPEKVAAYLNEDAEELGSYSLQRFYEEGFIEVVE